MPSLKMKLPLFAAALLAGFLVMAVYIHLETIRHPYIGAVLEHDEIGWRVSSVDPSGKAAQGQVDRGDRALIVDGMPAETWFAGKTQASLVRATTSAFMRSDGSVYELRIETESDDVRKSLLAMLLEVLLLAIGLLAYRKNPGSHTVRRFSMMNYVMALVILTVYSTELALSNLLLALSSIWLPYLLLSFCVAFVLRAVPLMWTKALFVFRLLCALFSCYALWAMVQNEIPSWLRGTLHLVFMLTLLFILVMVRLYWRSLDSVEKNHALVLVAGLGFSLLPYLLLYAIPDLLGDGYFLAPEYALSGLVPLSAIFLYVLNKRSMVDMQVYLPRLVIHTLYYGGVFLLFSLAYRTKHPLWVVAIFGGFAAGTWAYRKHLYRSERSAEGRRKWLDQQKLKLSIQVAKTRNIQDILSLMSEALHHIVDVEGICVIWQDEEGTRPVVHGTGKYEYTGTGEDACWMERSFWERNFDFEYVASIASHAEKGGKGYLCMGPKRNLSMFSAEEKGLIDEICVEAVRLLTNTRLLVGLHKEFQRTKEQNAAFERHVSDIRQTNRLLLEAQQAERIRLSYALHDHLLQNLIFLSRDLEELADQGRVDSKRVAAWLKCVYDSQQEIRVLCDELYPHIVDKADLEESLRWLLRTAGEKGGLNVSLHYHWHAEAPPPDPILKSNLFRIIRELVHNVLKHAEASRLDVYLNLEPIGVICCVVSDDGKGFDATAFPDHIASIDGGHLGLISVNSQIGYLGGEMDIQSKPGKGALITLRLRPQHHEQREGEKHERQYQSDFA